MSETEQAKVRFKVWDHALSSHPTEKRSIEEVSKEKIKQLFQKFWDTYSVPEERRLPIDFSSLEGSVSMSDWGNFFSFLFTNERLYEFSGQLCGWVNPSTKKIVEVMQKKLE